MNAAHIAMADYTLVIKADSGYESTSEGRCTAEQYGAAIAALHTKPNTLAEMREQRDELLMACRLFVAYDNNDATDGVAMMVAYSNAVRAARAAIANATGEATTQPAQQSGGNTPGWTPLTDEDRKAAFESMPDMLDGFLKTWGWLHFAKAIEAKCREKNGGAQ